MTCLPHFVLSLLLITVTSVCPLSQPVPRGAVQTQMPAGPAAQALTAALLAEHDGRDDDAQAGYRLILASADRATAVEAELALGRFLERRGRPADALGPLQMASAALGNSADGLAAEFLLGEAGADLHQTDAAVAAWQSYRQSGGPADGYAALEHAWTLQAAGDYHAALDTLLFPLQSSIPRVRREALKAASTSLERLGETPAAAADQQMLATLSPAAGDRSSALLEAGRLYHEAGDDQKAGDVLLTVVNEYPALGAAGTALERLDSLGVHIEPLQRALVLVDLHRDSQARPLLEAVLTSKPASGSAARANYELARLADRADQDDVALAGYRAAARLDPGGELAPEAVWRRAQLLRSLKRYGEAQTAYAELARDYPSSEHAGDAAFETGFMAFLDARSSDAAAIWSQSVQQSAGPQAARSYLWLGKLAVSRGDRQTALDLFGRAQAAQPAGFFGLRAQVLASGQTRSSLSGPALGATPADDWTAVESWLQSWAGSDQTDKFQGLELTKVWEEAFALDGLGWQTTPSDLIQESITSAQQQPWNLYHAARALHDRGLTHLALRAADALLDLAPGDLLATPPALMRIAYPIDYPDLVNPDAGQAGLDPLLIFAVVRQESAFDPSAGSSAGAQGLAQLLPGTAQDTARAIGIQDPESPDLKKPAVNLQLGSAFLAQQARAAAGDLDLTLAAYNAGAGNAAAWAKLAGGDPDLLYELVDFDETRLYIRLVSQNYGIYNLLYRGLPRPTLQPEG